MEGKLQADDVDRVIAELAERHHGVVALRDLLGIGITRKAVESRLRRGRLHRIHRGVYAVGHRILGPDGWRMAAVLAAGDDAALSHDAAAEFWRLRWMARSGMSRRSRATSGFRASTRTSGACPPTRSESS